MTEGVGLDPFQNIVGVSWSPGDIIGLFGVSTFIPFYARFHSPIIVPYRNIPVGVAGEHNDHYAVYGIEWSDSLPVDETDADTGAFDITLPGTWYPNQTGWNAYILDHYLTAGVYEYDPVPVGEGSPEDGDTVTKSIFVNVSKIVRDIDILTLSESETPDFVDLEIRAPWARSSYGLGEPGDIPSNGEVRFKSYKGGDWVLDEAGWQLLRSGGNVHQGLITMPFDDLPTDDQTFEAGIYEGHPSGLWPGYRGSMVLGVLRITLATKMAAFIPA